MRSKFLPILLVGLAGLIVLAFLLSGLVKSVIILPAARLFWWLTGYYHALPQSAYWVMALIIAAFLIFISLRLPVLESHRKDARLRSLPGPVKDISFWIQRSKTGLYPRWHIARLLAEMALELLDLRGNRDPHVLQPMGPDGSPPEGVRKYIDAALTTNFTDYPRPKRFRSLPPTPFDGDLEPVVRYLESLVESEHDTDS